MSFTNMDLNERAVLAMYERLSTNLNAVIDAINAERGTVNGVTYQIQHPQQVLTAPPVGQQLTNFPIVAIGDGDMTFTDDVGWAATGIYDMMVLAYDTDTDPLALAWKMRRWAQALVSVAMFGRQMTSTNYFGGFGVVLKKIMPGPRLRAAKQTDHSIMASVCVYLQIKDDQNPTL